MLFDENSLSIFWRKNLNNGVSFILLVLIVRLFCIDIEKQKQKDNL